MSDLHVLVVDDIRKVIGGKPVSLDDDKVFRRGSLPRDAVDEIDEAGARVGAEKADGMRLAVACSLF